MASTTYTRMPGLRWPIARRTETYLPAKICPRCGNTHHWREGNLPSIPIASCKKNLLISNRVPGWLSSLRLREIATSTWREEDDDDSNDDEERRMKMTTRTKKRRRTRRRRTPKRAKGEVLSSCASSSARRRMMARRRPLSLPMRPRQRRSRVAALFSLRSGDCRSYCRAPARDHVHGSSLRSGIWPMSLGSNRMSHKCIFLLQNSCSSRLRNVSSEHLGGVQQRRHADVARARSLDRRPARDQAAPAPARTIARIKTTRSATKHWLTLLPAQFLPDRLVHERGNAALSRSDAVAEPQPQGGQAARHFPALQGSSRACRGEGRVYQPGLSWYPCPSRLFWHGARDQGHERQAISSREAIRVPARERQLRNIRCREILMETRGRRTAFSSIGPIYYESKARWVINLDEDSITAIVRAVDRVRRRESKYEDSICLAEHGTGRRVIPLLVFVNVKSAGCQGLDLILNFRKLLNPYQGSTSTTAVPAVPLRLPAQQELQILVCVGAGTVGCVLHCLVQRPARTAVLPRGLRHPCPLGTCTIWLGCSDGAVAHVRRGPPQAPHRRHATPRRSDAREPLERRFFHPGTRTTRQRRIRVMLRTSRTYILLNSRPKSKTLRIATCVQRHPNHFDIEQVCRPRRSTNRASQSNDTRSSSQPDVQEKPHLPRSSIRPPWQQQWQAVSGHLVAVHQRRGESFRAPFSINGGTSRSVWTDSKDILCGGARAEATGERTRRPTARSTRQLIRTRQVQAARQLGPYQSLQLHWRMRKLLVCNTCPAFCAQCAQKDTSVGFAGTKSIHFFHENHLLWSTRSQKV
ncbi:unnamed protein product, partial [Trichogramma brassicae]